MMKLASKKVFTKPYGAIMERWDIKFYNAQLKSKYPLISLGEFIEERNEKIKLFDFPEEKFKILKVSNKTGVTLSYEELGKEFNQAYKKVFAGDIVYNPYRVNIGSIGLVPEECNGMYVSPAYVVFKVKDESYNSRVLEYILRADWYNEQIRAVTAGSVRQNLTFDTLKTLKLPKLPKEIQEQVELILKSELEYIEKAKILKGKILKITDDRFFNKLGLNIIKNTEKYKCFSRKSSHIERWGLRYNQNKLRGFDISDGKYSLVKLGDIIEKTQYGTSKKANDEGNGISILRMNNIKNRFLNLEDVKNIEISSKEEESLILEKGDILIIRSNGSRDLVGTSAVFDLEDRYVFASYLIRLKVNFTNVNPKYLSWFINSELGRQQVELVSRQIMQNNINSEEIKSLVLPLPPKDEQDNIMKIIDSKMKKVDSVDRIIENRKEMLECKLKEIILI